MATGSTPQVSDWQTVQEPTDWQTVGDENALPKGVKIVGRNSAGQPIYGPEGTAPPQTVGRFLSSAGGAIADTAKGLYHSVTDAPRNQQEEEAGPIFRTAKRLFIDPQVEQGKQALDPNLTTSERVGHGLASITPMLGPWAATVAEDVGKKTGGGDYVGAGGEVAGNAAIALAPKAVAKALPKIGEAGAGVARAVSGTGKSVGELVDSAQKGNAAANAYIKTQAAIETARKNALQVGNEKYSTVNEALSHIPADMEKVNEIYSNAAESFGEAQSQPQIITRLGKALEKGEALTYADEQKLYSELGRELSKGTLPGATYHAYDLMHDAIGEDMQRIADSQGQGEALNDARAYWKRMKQAFGKPYNPTDTATGALESAAPKMAQRGEAATRANLLSAFDPNLPGMLNDLARAEEEAPPNAPAPGEKSTVGAKEVQGAKTDALNKRADWIAHRGNWAAASPFFYIMKDMVHGNFGALPDAALGGGAIIAGVQGIAQMLRNPKVVEFLTKATPKDIEQIPPDLRGDFPQIVQQAQKSGINVSPALAAMAGANQKKRPADFLDPQGESAKPQPSNPEDQDPAVSFKANQKFAKPGPYATKLPALQEAKFREWVKANNVPWQDTPDADYDMRGYWKALQSGTAKQEKNQWDGKMHFPDKWKTPYDATFSNESQYALPNAPHWDGDRLIGSDGRLIVDETPQ